VAELVNRTSYSIGYAELTYAVRNHLLYGIVANSSGRFVKADSASVTAAAADFSEKMPEDFRVSITDAPGDGPYPISSFTWILIPSVVPEPAKREALVEFLRWGLTSGQGLLDSLSYARLPDSVIAKEQSAIDRIQAPRAATASTPLTNSRSAQPASILCYCGFDAEQQAPVEEDGAGEQHAVASDVLDAATRGAILLPYKVFSPKVWNVSHEMPLGSDTHPLLPRA
jgi:hypothetical protein